MSLAVCFQVYKYFKPFQEAANDDGIIAVSSGEWGSTFEKQIGRTSCGLAVALAYTRQVKFRDARYCVRFKNMRLFSNNGKTHYFYIRSLLEFRVRYQHPLCVQNLMVSTDQPFLGLKKV